MSTIKVAQVDTFGQTPHVVTKPLPPAPSETEVQITFLAGSITGLVKARAAGKHYSAHGLPHIAGADGVGKLSSGELVYFSALSPTGGSFASVLNVPKQSVAPVPAGADPVQIAGLMNPLMGCWMPFTSRVDLEKLPKGYKVAIIGVTSMSGKLAVGVARHFGAGSVVGIARSAAKMEGLQLDAKIEFADDPTATDYSAAADADLILDFLWGPHTVALFRALKTEPSGTQYVNIGQSAAGEVMMPADIFRGKNLTVRGTGPGAWSFPQLGQQLAPMAKFLAEGAGGAPKQNFQVAKLDDVEKVWDQGGDRTVLTA